MGTFTANILLMIIKVHSLLLSDIFDVEKLSYNIIRVTWKVKLLDVFIPALCSSEHDSRLMNNVRKKCCLDISVVFVRSYVFF